ncbi:hypothetical protein CRE_08876 [Caenorhabditis remanei]|uniref:Serpentine Receptor, class H n=1 Tax=Caenorhabditis remanei TaxID=31234 RepID=E3LI02_CAERE|nr:hypothetical protein CRE_08876 [Caenorhabditis remanei]
MSSVKWYLVNMHIWIILFDYSIGLLTMPLLLIPCFAGYPLGILRHLGVSTLDQIVLVFLIFGSTATAIVVVIFSFSSATLLEYVQKEVDLGPLYSRNNHTFPCLPRYIYDAPVFVLAENYVYHLGVCIVYLVICGIEVFSILIYIGWKFLQQLRSKTISQRTYQMQKNFFIALLIHGAIPFLMLIAPVGSFLISILTYHYNQAVTNFDIIIITMHGSVSTFVMIVAHSPYREAIRIMFRKRTVVSVDISRKVVFHSNRIGTFPSTG